MASLTIVASIAALVVAIVGGLAVFQQSSPVPTCSVCKATNPQQTHIHLSKGTSYQVLVCDRCSHPSIEVHGLPSEVAYCESCMQRALRVYFVAVPNLADHATWELYEECQVCQHKQRYLFEVPNHQHDATILKFDPSKRRTRPKGPTDTAG